MSTQLQSHASPTVARALPTVGAGASRSLIQRKCACGGSGGLAGDCETCDQKKLSLQRSTQDAEVATRNSVGVPPIVHDVLRSPGQPLDSETRAFMEPRFGHHFSRVQVQSVASQATNPRAALGPAFNLLSDRARFRTSLSEENLDWQTEPFEEANGNGPTGIEATPTDGGKQGPATLPGTKTGGTGCDASTGTTASNVSNKDPCTMDCSASHEQKHAVDIGPCCTKAGVAANKAEKPEDKEAVQQKFDEWMINNANFLECRAYAVSISCGEGKKSKLKCADSNEKCCVPLTRYISSAMRQKEGTCNNAGQKLTDCPF